MRYVLGIDGGGTKTECVVLDERDSVVATGRAGPSNPVRVGFEQAVSALQESADAALRQAGVTLDHIVALCAGLAGTGDPGVAQKIQVGINRAFPGFRVKLCTDLDIALAAVGDGPAVLLIAGTGSAAVGRAQDGRIERTGGHGWLAGDQGSANDVGKNAVSAARRHCESTGQESALGGQLLSALAILSWQDLRSDELAFDVPLRGMDSKAEDTITIYPQLFPVVAKAADTGDPMAQAILTNAAQHLADLAANLVIKLDLEKVPFRLSRTGGMIGCCAFFDAELDRRLREVAPGGAISDLPATPAQAAARMAWRSFEGCS
jgi:N-acetylglucosamine kinase-like BadF-type ATPase